MYACLFLSAKCISLSCKAQGNNKCGEYGYIAVTTMLETTMMSTSFSSLVHKNNN